MVVATPEQRSSAERTAANLGERAAGVFAQAAMHTPLDVTERALLVATQMRADGLLAIGGGSTTGLAKAIAFRTDLPQIVVPTTYAGSEMTPILGETRGGAKTTLRSLKVLPETVIYDVDLTLTLPAELSATSGLNAIAHAVEALYAEEKSPLVAMTAEEGVRAFARALPAIVREPQDRDVARTRSTAHGSAGPASARWEWRCITSSVTRWAVPSTSAFRDPRGRPSARRRLQCTSDAGRDDAALPGARR